MAHIIMAHNKFFWGEAHERFQRLRVFHAQPLSSFSCNSFKETYAGCGAQLLLKEGQNWPEKQFSTKILFFKILVLSILVPGTKIFWYPVPNFGTRYQFFGTRYQKNFGNRCARPPFFRQRLIIENELFYSISPNNKKNTGISVNDAQASYEHV